MSTQIDIAKTVGTYAKVYRKVLNHRQESDIDQRVQAYEKRLHEMYASDQFEKHHVYPSTDTVYIYAVIAMCLELKEEGLSDKEIIDSINSGFSARRNFFKYLIKTIDLLPFSYKIAEKWNISDHEKRVKDGSIHYETFDVQDGMIEYNITRCAYVDMFETWGIRSLCKIFCMTDTTAYSNLTHHVKFVRYSDLSDGESCHDQIFDRKKLKRE